MANSVKTSKPAKAGQALKAVPLKAWNKTAQTELISHGLLKDFFPKGTKSRFIPKNFRDKTKNVVLRCVTPDDTLYFLACSKAVSQLVRDNEISLPQLAGLPITEGEQLNKETGEMEPSFRISMPQDAISNTPEFEFGSMESEELEISSDWLPEKYRVL